MGLDLNGKGTELALPADWRKWLAATRVCTRLGLNPRQLKKKLDEGSIPPPLDCPDGTQRWNPEIIEQLEDALAEGAASSEALEIAATGQANKDMSVGLARLVAQATQHAERSFVSHERATQAVLSTLRDVNRDLAADNERLREELRKREDIHLELMKQREGLISEQAMRDIAQREHAATQERKKRMFDLVLQRAPGILSKVSKSLGLEGEDMARVQAVIDLAEDLDPALLEMLATSGALTAKQVPLVEKIIGRPIKVTPAAEPATTEGQATNEQQNQ